MMSFEDTKEEVAMILKELDPSFDYGDDISMDGNDCDARDEYGYATRIGSRTPAVKDLKYTSTDPLKYGRALKRLLELFTLYPELISTRFPYHLHYDGNDLAPTPLHALLQSVGVSSGLVVPVQMIEKMLELCPNVNSLLKMKERFGSESLGFPIHVACRDHSANPEIIELLARRRRDLLSYKEKDLESPVSLLCDNMYLFSDERFHLLDLFYQLNGELHATNHDLVRVMTDECRPPDSLLHSMVDSPNFEGFYDTDSMCVNIHIKEFEPDNYDPLQVGDIDFLLQLDTLGKISLILDCHVVNAALLQFWKGMKNNDWIVRTKINMDNDDEDFGPWDAEEIVPAVGETLQHNCFLQFCLIDGIASPETVLLWISTLQRALSYRSNKEKAGWLSCLKSFEVDMGLFRWEANWEPSIVTMETSIVFQKWERLGPDFLDRFRREIVVPQLQKFANIEIQHNGTDVGPSQDVLRAWMELAPRLLNIKLQHQVDLLPVLEMLQDNTSIRFLSIERPNPPTKEEIEAARTLLREHNTSLFIMEPFGSQDPQVRYYLDLNGMGLSKIRQGVSLAEVVSGCQFEDEAQEVGILYGFLRDHPAMFFGNSAANGGGQGNQHPGWHQLGGRWVPPGWVQLEGRWVAHGWYQLGGRWEPPQAATQCHSH